MLRYEEVAELVRIIDSSSCAELILDTADLKLVVRRHGAGTQSPPSTTEQPSPVTMQKPAAAEPATPPAQQAAETQDPRGVDVGVTRTIVEAPMIGTFYRAPSPGAAPFVEPESRIKAGDPLCLIEVMKLYTTIYAPVDGVVREICAGDGGLVEYGQALFVIELE